MSTTVATPAGVELEHELFAIVKRERRARDFGDWDVLAGSYWPDAYVRVTWFEGSAAEFIEESRGSLVPGRPGGMHVITPSWCEANGDRALVESQGEIVLRPNVNGVPCDVTNWCRFFSRLERRNGEWRLLSFDSIYCRDRLDPVIPGHAVELDLDELATGRASYQYLTYINRRRGCPVAQDLPGNDRPDLLEAFYADAREWLDRGELAREGRWRPTTRA